MTVFHSLREGSHERSAKLGADAVGGWEEGRKRRASSQNARRFA